LVSIDPRSKKEHYKEIIILLLSHHTKDKLHRTLHCRVCNHDIYLCTRCYSTIAGLLISSGLLVSLKMHFLKNTNLSLVLFLFFLLPPMIDWSSQYIGFRESTNRIRFATGFLLGFSISILKYVPFNFEMIIILLSIFCAIAMIKTSIARKSGR